jgi:hypothetical protein
MNKLKRAPKHSIGGKLLKEAVHSAKELSKKVLKADLNITPKLKTVGKFTGVTVVPIVGANAALGYIGTNYLNPKSWNLNDYTKESTFNEAFAKARNNKEKEFMYAGKRYNTNLVPKDIDQNLQKEKEFFYTTIKEAIPKSITLNSSDSSKVEKDDGDYQKVINNRNPYDTDKKEPYTSLTTKENSSAWQLASRNSGYYTYTN